MMPFLSVPFRPFFFGAAWMAAGWLLIWLYWLFIGMPALPMNPIHWHAHEMIFGFTTAVISGFVLTAVQNWTGVRSTVPWALAALFLLWLAGRVVMLLAADLPYLLVATVDVALMPAVAITLSRPILRTNNRRNLVFLPLLALFTFGNLAFHLAVLGKYQLNPSWVLDGMLLLIAFLLTFMGGRVIPFFTRSRLPQVKVQRFGWLDWSATILAGLAALVWLSAGPGVLFTATALAAGAATLLRVLFWRPWRTLGEPLLWILHLGYLWLPVGYALLAAGHTSPGLHALSVGALGCLSLGMLARVSLGHTGRPLVAHPAMTAGFILVALAGLLRVGLVLGLPTWLSLGGAGVLWSIAFAIYGVLYAPALFTPRPDAAPLGQR